MAQRTAGGNAAFHNFHNDYAHIADPNERRRLALAEIDKAPFGWYHVRAIVVAGIGFFTDAYDIFAIGLVTTMLGVVYWHNAASPSKPGYIDSSADTAIKVRGQLATQHPASSNRTTGRNVGGYRDWTSRIWYPCRHCRAEEDVRTRIDHHHLRHSRPGPVVQLALHVDRRGDHLLACTYGDRDWRRLPIVVHYHFGICNYQVERRDDVRIPSSCRFWALANTKTRGSVFAMQGIGQFAAGIIALIAVSGFKDSLSAAKTVAVCDGNCAESMDKIWRIIIGFGAVPGCIALYYRLTIPETPRFTFDVARDPEKAGEDTKAYIQGRHEGHPDEISRVQGIAAAEQSLTIPKASWRDFMRHYGQWKNGKVLLGTAGSWFFLDVSLFPERSPRLDFDSGTGCVLRPLSQQHGHPPSHWLL